MLVAHHLASRVLPRYRCKCSRHDFTMPQLFACLCVKEMSRCGYRGAEALLSDCWHWCRAIGMSKAPDHNTLCSAAAWLLRRGNVGKFLDAMARWAAQARMLGLSVRPLALDSSMYESHHVSRHYERRRARSGSGSRSRPRSPKKSRRKRTVRHLPKLAVAADTRSHLVLAEWTGRGLGSDSPHFAALLSGARRRVLKPARFKVVADAGYDAEHNHLLARQEMGLALIVPATIGRTPAGDERIRTRWRRRMRRLLRTKRSRRRCGYTQRWQVETVTSMMKRNLGSALRGRTDAGRRRDLRLKVLVHNLMIFRSSARVETEHSRPL
jgi:DDE family transposase